jgi:hypothetical protein
MRKRKQGTETQTEILSPLEDYVFSMVFGDQRHIDITTMNSVMTAPIVPLRI